MSPSVSRRLPTTPTHQVYSPPKDGRKAYDTACKECRSAMDEATIFCGRFKLGEQLHRSATCVVYLALDVRNDGALVVVKLMLYRDQYEREVRWGTK